MSLFHKEKKIDYNPEKEFPAVKRSICTGERVAGFVRTGDHGFRDEMLIRDDRDLEEFCRRCGIDKSTIKEIV